MRPRLLRTRALSAAVVALLLFQATSAQLVVRAADPAASSAPAPSVVPSPSADPSSPPPQLDSPAPSPAASPTPQPSPAPDASPTPAPSPPPSPVDPATGLKPGATEVVNKRTESSQTYDNHDGSYSTVLSSAPEFYQAAGSSDWQPIALGFTKGAKTDGLTGSVPVVTSDQAPATVSLFDLTSKDFVTVTDNTQSIGFGLPLDAAKAAQPTTPIVDGISADYIGIQPEVDLRIIARAMGSKAFVILHSAPVIPSYTFRVDAPGLTLVPQKDGSISLVDASGVAVATIPHPYALDSTVDDASGGGRYTDQASVVVGKDTDGAPTITISLDPTWLKTATFPAYLDPSAQFLSTNNTFDAHTASAFPSANYHAYQRPDSPFYYEMWLGTDPSGTSGTSYDFISWDLSSIGAVTVDSTTVSTHPYHQYYASPTVERSWIGIPTASWTEAGITWSNQPSAGANITFIDGVQGSTTASNPASPLDAAVQGWIDGTTPNRGIRIWENGNGSTYWKRLIASEDSTNTSWRPTLTVNYHLPVTTSTTPAFSGSISWSFSAAQTQFKVEIATDSGFVTKVASSGAVTGAASSWYIVPTTVGGMTDDTQYWYHVQAYDGHSWSPFTTAAQFTWDAYQRGDESYYAQVPFDLSGGWNLEVGAHNGAATLSRSFFTIPSYGPPQSLEMSYSSTGPTTTGMFGAGWSSNLTQYLSFETGLIVWHRPDGGRVAFPSTGGAAVGGHFETISIGMNDVVTLTDQTKLTFLGAGAGAGAGHLVSIANRFGKALTVTGWGTTSVTATDASTRTTTLTVDTGNGRVSTVTDSALRAWTFIYAGTGTASDLTQIIEPDPDGAGPLPAPSTTLAYTSHQLTTVTRSRTKAAGGTDSIVWAIGYTSGRVATVTDPIGAQAVPVATNTFTYTAATTTTPTKTDVGLLQVYSPITRLTTHYTLDGRARVTTTIDPGNWTTTRTFDDKGNLTAVTRPVDTTPHYGTWSYSYDAAGNALQATEPLTASTNVVTKYAYNATNDVLTVSQADGDAAEVVTLNSYDGAGHLVSVVENCTTSGTTLPSPASSCTAAGTHDGSTNLTTSNVYTANDQIDVEWDPLGIATKHSYDSFGNETATAADCTTTGTTIPTRGSTCSAAGTHDSATNVVISHSFSLSNNGGKIGLPNSMTDPVGAVTTYDYDVLGRETVVVLPTDASIPALTTTMVLDEFDDILTTTNTWPGILWGDRVTTDVYDYRGRLTNESTTPTVTSSTHTFDAVGNEVQTVASGVATTRSNFDSLGDAWTEAAAQGTGDEIDTTNTFDPRGNLLTTLVNGATKIQTYDYSSRLTTEKDVATGITVTHFYDALGRENRTDTSGSATAYATFDRGGRAIQEIDTAGLKTDTAFDADGNLISRSHPYSTGSPMAIDTTAFDALHRPTAVIVNYVFGGSGADQNLTTLTAYDASGRTVATMDPKGTVTLTVVNVRGAPSKVVDNCVDSPPPTNWWQCSGTGTKTTLQNLTTTTAYDGSAGVVTAIKIRVAPPNATSTSVFDGAGRVIATQDARGMVSRVFYDSSGNAYKSIANCVDTSPPPNWWECAGSAAQDGTQNLTTLDTFDAVGRNASETAPNGRVTTKSYDEDGHLVKVVDNDVASPTQPDQDVTTDYHFDSLGRQDGMRDAAGRVTINHYDTTSGFLTWIVTRCVDTSPPVNWWQCSGTATPDSQTNLKTTYVYDTSGRKISMTAPGPNAVHSDVTTKVTTEYAYDANGHMCRVLEAVGSGIVLQSLSDPCSTTVSGTTLTNLSTRYQYDANGNLTSMIDAAGHTTGYSFDKDGNVISLTDADGHSLAWTYDGQGHKLTQTNRGTGGITWTYDEAGRILSRIADGVTVTYGYDLNGNRTTVSSASQTITTTYDAVNRPLATTDNTDAGAATAFTYGLVSETRTDPSSPATYAFTFDKFGREIGMLDPIHGSSSPWTMVYAADGLATSVVAPNGNTTAYGYDSAGRLVSSTTTGVGPVTRATYTYTYNAAGQRLSEDSSIMGDTANGTASFSYDPLAQLASYSGVAGISSGTYGFDKVPNRITKQIGGGATVTTTFDASNRPTVDSSGGSYVADFDGRITTRPYNGGSETLAYDSLGRLTSVIVGGVTTTYGYDLLDRLVTITRGAAQSKLRYVGTTTTLAQVRDGSNVTVYNLATDLTGDPKFDFSGGGVSQRFYGTNDHHDVTWLADATGAVISTERFDPWGVPTVTSGTAPDLRFQGSWYDANTGLSWAVNRWYAPDLGTFTSEDTILGQPDEPGNRQLYAYGAGDPVGRSDVQGRFWHAVRPGETLTSLATTFLGNPHDWAWIWNDNRRRIRDSNLIQVGWCLWIPQTVRRSRVHDDVCSPRLGITVITNTDAIQGAATLGIDLRVLTYKGLINLTRQDTHRLANPDGFLSWWYQKNANSIDQFLSEHGWPVYQGHLESFTAGVEWLSGNGTLPQIFGSEDAATLGNIVYLASPDKINNDGLTAHEYIHVLQAEDGGVTWLPGYLAEVARSGSKGANHYEALAYIWQGYIDTYGNTAIGWRYGDNQPWCTFKPLVSVWDYCPSH